MPKYIDVEQYCSSMDIAISEHLQKMQGDEMSKLIATKLVVPFVRAIQEDLMDYPAADVVEVARGDD